MPRSRVDAIRHGSTSALRSGVLPAERGERNTGGLRPEATDTVRPTSIF